MIEIPRGKPTGPYKYKSVLYGFLALTFLQLNFKSGGIIFSWQWI
jgi:hypothetical protein